MTPGTVTPLCQHQEHGSCPQHPADPAATATVSTSYGEMRVRAARPRMGLLKEGKSLYRLCWISGKGRQWGVSMAGGFVMEKREVGSLHLNAILENKVWYFHGAHFSSDFQHKIYNNQWQITVICHNLQSQIPCSLYSHRILLSQLHSLASNVENFDSFKQS